ncbi:glycosyltransferase family 2 protein [Actinotignum sp. GS-2025c]|uniref:glycosyltransferase family 2 protein n=1 Tax=Actinotignum sp. GS-2025c TaxID=3427276 RepID=UPI003F46B136
MTSEQDRHPRLVVLIPAWNEEEALPAVLTELRQAVPHASLVVINDCSRDATAQVAAAGGATVLNLPINLGVGGAMRTGYLYAWRHGFDRAVQVDADGQHRPEDIARLLEQMDATGADIVIGARFAERGSYRVRGPRAWAMRFLSKVLSRVHHTRLTDTTSGFKLTNRRAIGVLADELPAEYLGDTIEALIIASKAGLRVTQVGVEMRERQGGTPSHNPLKAARLLLRGIIAMAVASTRPAQKDLDGTEGRQ